MSHEQVDTLESQDRFSGSTVTSSRRFHASTDAIPTPGQSGNVPKPYNPLILRLPVVIGIPFSMFLLGVALEIAIFISNVNNGFKVPVNNIFNIFGNVSAQFLASFFPTLLIMPVAIAWRELDWNVRTYQPYLLLQKGNARAEESLLLDYVFLGPALALFRALHYKHRIVFWSALTAMMTYAFQPLSGSIFQIRQAQQNDTMPVTSIKSIGLSNGAIDDLNGFMAAAGYVDATAILNNLGDPPFVTGGWATAEVDFPVFPFLNGTMTVTTSGIQTTTNCSNPSQAPLLTPLTNGNFNLSSISVNGCQHSLVFNPNASTLQYGVEDVVCPGDNGTSEVKFRPVMFWYFNTRADNTSEVATVFCAPTIKAYQVQAVANLNDGSLVKVIELGPFIQDNNVTGSPQNGQAFNGVIFSDNIENPFIQARANATRSIVPGSIFHAAARLPNGPQSTFDLPNGFLDLTTTFYTRHLSVSAKSVYFVDQNTTLQANVASLVPRLVIDDFPAHLLAVILMLTGVIGVFIHFNHRRQRKTLLLATQPGSIASVVALTARSGFGELLLPYDDELTLEKKLDGLRFRLDRRTGAILADDYETERAGMGRDDAMMSLLGTKGQQPDDDLPQSAMLSSSLLAYRAAGGTLPPQTPPQTPPIPMNWERSWDPHSPQPQAKPQLSETEYVP